MIEEVDDEEYTSSNENNNTSSTESQSDKLVNYRDEYDQQFHKILSKKNSLKQL